jgi:ADP-ribose pyrophosphatase YjhB (NUDIX family)
MTPENQNFAFCPECGKQTVSYIKGRHWVCAECGFDLYNNVAAAVGLILVDRDGKALFVKRAKAPRQGFYALPGGFVDPGESGEEAALRECREETGLVLEGVRYLCSFPNVYEYKSIVYTTCDMFFTGSLSQDLKFPEALRGDPQEVTGFGVFPVTTREDIAAIPLAFPSAVKALETYLLRG